MNSIKKTIFLSNKQDTKNKSMAIVTLEKKNGNIYGTIKTFNLDNRENYILGIKYDDKIYKQNVNLDNSKYNFLLSNLNNLTDNIGCVLLTSEKNNYTPIIWGSNNNTNYKSQIVNSLKSNFEKIKNNEVIKKDNAEPHTNSTHFAYSKHENFRAEGDGFLNQSRINIEDHSIHASTYLDENKVKEDIVTPYHSEVAIASNYASLFDSSNEEIEKEIDKEINKLDGHEFYNMIAEQLDELFEKYPKEETLEKLIDNSKWIKIRNDDNKYYVVGIIFNNNDIKYICYGVPGNYSKEPPIELREYSQWLPTDIMNPFDNGYWVMYQDADSGENVVIN